MYRTCWQLSLKLPATLEIRLREIDKLHVLLGCDSGCRCRFCFRFGLQTRGTLCCRARYSSLLKSHTRGRLVIGASCLVLWPSFYVNLFKILRNRKRIECCRATLLNAQRVGNLAGSNTLVLLSGAGGTLSETLPMCI